MYGAVHTQLSTWLALVDTVEVIRLGADLFVKWIESVSAVGDDHAAGAAASAVYTVISNEFVIKMPPESRGPAEKAGNHHSAKVMGCIREVLTEQRVRQIFTGSMKDGIVSHDDLSLACGWASATFWLSYMHPGACATASEIGMFSAALTLHHRVEPSPLSGEWWLSTCDVVDVTSAQLTSLYLLFSSCKRVPSATQAPSLTQKQRSSR